MKRSTIVAILASLVPTLFPAASQAYDYLVPVGATTVATRVAGSNCVVLDGNNHISPKWQLWSNGAVFDDYAPQAWANVVCPLQTEQIYDQQTGYGHSDVSGVYIDSADASGSNIFTSNSSCILCMAWGNCVTGTTHGNYYTWGNGATRFASSTWSPGPWSIQCSVPTRTIITDYGFVQNR